MSIYGFPYGSQSGDRKYGVDVWQLFFQNILTTGVFMHDAADSFQVVESSGMDTTLKIGFANLNGVFVYTDADVDYSHSAVSGSSRDDLVCVRSDYVDRDPEIVVYEGATQSAGVWPVQRDGSAYEVAVAVVHLAADSTSITQSMIEDLRLDDDVCGLVQGIVQQVDTSTLYDQIVADLDDFQTVNEAAFTAWFSSIQDIFDASAETNLLTLINARLELAGTSEMTGDLLHGNNKSQYKDSSDDLIAEIDPQDDGLKITVYNAATPVEFYIKNDGAMTIDGNKVWTADNMIVSEDAPVVGDLNDGDVYLQIITE